MPIYPAPTITSLSATQTASSCNPYYVTYLITSTATDNVSVTASTVSWSGAMNGSAQMSFDGASWNYQLQATVVGNYTVSVIAVDEAGNASVPAVTQFSLQSCIL